jgi:hypothetical protein
MTEHTPMARATIPAGTPRGQTADDPVSPAEAGPTFANLFEARDAVCRGVGRLDDELTALEGDLSAVEGLSLMAVEQHQDALGPTATGLHHCAGRALETLRQVRELHGRIAEAATVAHANDSTRLSAAACRGYHPGPHVPSYGAATAGDAP